jgi:hypothetical protein
MLAPAYRAFAPNLAFNLEQAVVLLMRSPRLAEPIYSDCQRGITARIENFEGLKLSNF